MFENNRWGRLFSLAYTHPKLLAFGISDNTAIELTQHGAQVLGENALISLDLRRANFDRGNNHAFVIANGFMDVFAPQDRIVPEKADIHAAPIRAATPIQHKPTILPPTISPTETLAPTNTIVTARWTPAQTVHSSPSRANRATPTPSEVPRVTDEWLLQSMILLAIISVIVILIGVWFNWDRINPR